MKLYISEPEPRESGAILISDDDRNDIAEFYHNEHATVGQSYETALALAQTLVTGAAAQPTREGKSPEWFCQWLKGYLGGIPGRDELDAFEANSIRNTLNEVLAAQPPAAPVDTATKSAPVLGPPQNYAERLPTREEAGAGADTQCSADSEAIAQAYAEASVAIGRRGTEECSLADQIRHLIKQTLNEPQTAREQRQAERRERTGLDVEEAMTLEEDCGCIGAVIGQHERSCPLSRPNRESGK